MKYYAVIDTNVIISALLIENSVPAFLLKMVRKGTIIPVLSEDILDEYKEQGCLPGNWQHETLSYKAVHSHTPTND